MNVFKHIIMLKIVSVYDDSYTKDYSFRYQDNLFQADSKKLLCKITTENTVNPSPP